MPVSRRLSDVIEEVIGVLEAQGAARNSIQSARQTYDHLLGFMGNIQIKYMDSRKVDEFFLDRQRRGEKPATLNSRRTWIRKLVKIAHMRRYMNHDPIGHVPVFKGVPRRKLFIPRKDFPRLLEAATDPRDRIAVALGLYQFHRIGEICALRVGDVDLDAKVVHKTNFKSKELDDLPISTELDRELRRWFLHYTGAMGGPLMPDWYLVPRRAKAVPYPKPDGTYGMKTTEDQLYDPLKPATNPHRMVQGPIHALGYSLTDANGKPLREGGHTLRRSGARALYDRLREDGRVHDDVNRIIQSMLGHKQFSTTEIYLEMDVDKAKRNLMLAGQPMFPEPEQEATIIELPHTKG